jgi:erythromycin esterase
MTPSKSAAQLQAIGRRSLLATTAGLGAAALIPSSASASSAKSASPHFASVDDWIAREAISFSSDKQFDAAVDRLMAKLGDQISVLGFGEPLHSGDEFLVIRNRLFQRLVKAHGFRAITIETNDMRARLVDDYIAGRTSATYEAIKPNGFTNGIGDWVGNHDLVEWMRAYNADPAHAVKLNLYGTLASDQETTASPRTAIEFALAYLQSIDAPDAARHRAIFEPLLGANSEWEDSAAQMAKEIMAKVIAGDKAAVADTTNGLGVSPRAEALRLALENLTFEFKVRRAEFVSKTGGDAFGVAQRHLIVARNLLAMHAGMARHESLDNLVTMRDAMAGEHLAYVADREQPRGRVLVFMHSIHLRRTKSKLPWYEFWPTGAHLDHLLGPRFAVIAGAVGTSEPNFIGAPEAGSLEARLLARKSDCFLPTWRGRGLPEGALAALPVRTGSRPYIPYTPLTAQSVADYDAIAFLSSVSYTRGAPPQPG